MTRMDDLRMAATPVDPFLYASVGEDRNGNLVTVLSALARLGLDPVDAAAELSRMTQEEARSRLGGLLAGFGDIPALGQDTGAITLRLIDLLPRSSGRQAAQAAPPAGSSPPTPGESSGIGRMLAIFLLILFIFQAFFSGSDGMGE